MADSEGATQPRKDRGGRPLKAPHEKIAKRVLLSFTQAQYDAVMADYDDTIYPATTDYLRARLVDKRIKKRVIHANLERLEHALVASNETLNRLGVNVNQLAKHLNTYKSPALKSEVITLLKLFVKSQETMESMHATIHEIHEKW